MGRQKHTLGEAIGKGAVDGTRKKRRPTHTVHVWLALAMVHNLLALDHSRLNLYIKLNILGHHPRDVGEGQKAVGSMYSGRAQFPPEVALLIALSFQISVTHLMFGQSSQTLTFII